MSCTFIFIFKAVCKLTCWSCFDSRCRTQPNVNLNMIGNKYKGFGWEGATATIALASVNLVNIIIFGLFFSFLLWPYTADLIRRLATIFNFNFSPSKQKLYPNLWVIFLLTSYAPECTPTLHRMHFLIRSSYSSKSRKAYKILRGWESMAIYQSRKKNNFVYAVIEKFEQYELCFFEMNIGDI